MAVNALVLEVGQYREWVRNAVEFMVFVERAAEPLGNGLQFSTISMC